MSEFVRNGDTGLLAPPGDPAALASTISVMLRDRSQARSMGERAQALLHGSHTVEQMARGFESVYDELLGRA